MNLLLPARPRITFLWFLPLYYGITYCTLPLLLVSASIFSALLSFVLAQNKDLIQVSHFLQLLLDLDKEILFANQQWSLL